MILVTDFFDVLISIIYNGMSQPRVSGSVRVRKFCQRRPRVEYIQRFHFFDSVLPQILIFIRLFLNFTL